MKHLLAGLVAAASLAAVVSAQGPPQGRGAQAPPGPPSPAAQKHIDAARAAAGTEHAVMVDKLCGRATPTQSTERAQPVKVFDHQDQAASAGQPRRGDGAPVRGRHQEHSELSDGGTGVRPGGHRLIVRSMSGQ